MCGVCGLIRPVGSVATDLGAVAMINGLQQHRGPDGAGDWHGASGTLGHTRLAIVDLTEGGRQPFRSPDGTIAVVFNGEIYNHQELRDRYGLATVNRCDGAVLPELWVRLGTAMFAELRGMYAICVFDGRVGTTTLARDPFGIKPLCWTRTPDGALAFASEARSLTPLLVRPHLNATAVRHYLMNGAMDRDESAFQDISSVAANTWTQWDSSLTRTEGAIQPGLFDNLPDSGPEQLREEFLRSVSVHLRSDVPMALLLSSGLDSAAIAWACAELGASVTCVTVDTGTGMGEWDSAHRTARRFGHEHERLSAVPDATTVCDYFQAMQKPSIDGLNTFLVSKAIAGIGVKVAMSGLGGDELLGGYRFFRLLRYLPLLRAGHRVLPSRPLTNWAGRHAKLGNLLAPGGPTDATSLGALIRRLLLDSQVDTLLPAQRSVTPQAEVSSYPPALALSVAEIAGYLGGTLLADTDAFSMAWSIEMRVPFVDRVLARTALAIDPHRGVGKRRFAMSLGDAELRRISRRPKHGFTLPMDAWMRGGPLAPLVSAAGCPDAPVRAILRPDAVDRLLTGWRDGRIGWSRAWALVALDAWLRTLDPAISGAEMAAADEMSDDFLCH